MDDIHQPMQRKKQKKHQCNLPDFTKPTYAPTRTPTHNPTVVGGTAAPISVAPTPAPITYSPVTLQGFGSASPTTGPSFEPSLSPTSSPTTEPSFEPSLSPTASPTTGPSFEPSLSPTSSPTTGPSFEPSLSSTSSPTTGPSFEPSLSMCIREEGGGGVDTSGNFHTYIYGRHAGSLSGQSENPTYATYGAGDCTGGDVVFVGEYVNVGINGISGTFGTRWGVSQASATWGQCVAGGQQFPMDWSDSSDQYVFPVPPSGRLGFVADYNMDGWGPTVDDKAPYSGDYFMPGEQIEGWVLEYTDENVDHRFVNMPFVGATVPFRQTIPTSFTITSSNTTMSSMWVSQSGNVQVTILFTLEEQGLYYTYQTSLKNTGSTTLTDVGFMRVIDPDNAHDFLSNSVGFDTGYSTNNYVIYQPGESGYTGPVNNAALVCAAGHSYSQLMASGQFSGITVPANGALDLFMCMGSVHPNAMATHGVRKQ